MATTVRYAEEVVVVPPGSAQAKAAIEAGYQLTEEAAKAVIAQWNKLPGSIPYTDVQAAQALIAGLTAKPVVVSTRPGWRRSHSAP